MREVKIFDNGKNSEASAPVLWVCVGLSDTAVAMVAEFTQKTQKEDKLDECLRKTQERGDGCRGT